MSAPTDAVQEEQPDSGERRRRVLSIALVVIAVVLVGIVGAVTAYVISIDRSVTRNIVREDSMPDAEESAGPSASPRPTKDPEAGEALNYVLLGSDSRDPGNVGSGRSDSLMIVHLNQARDKAYIISFPRDMWVDVPGHGRSKINAAYAYGGPKLTVRTLENLVGARMDHLVQIDFEGFVQLTESLGGVTVTNDHEFSAQGYHFPMGEITISGDQALAFVRERKSLPRGDLDRAENQRKVIQAIFRKGLSREVVTDPAAFPAFVGGVAQHLTVDSGLTDSEIRKTAISLRLSASDIVPLQAPISGFATIRGQAVDVVDQQKLAELATALAKDTMDRYVEKYPEG